MAKFLVVRGEFQEAIALPLDQDGQDETNEVGSMLEDWPNKFIEEVPEESGIYLLTMDISLLHGKSEVTYSNILFKKVMELSALN